MFQAILADLAARVGGIRWAMVAGEDGVLLECYCSDDPPEADSLAAEYAAILRACRKVAGQTACGHPKAITLAAEKGRLLLQVLTPEYFLLIYLDSSALAGKAQFEITRARESIIGELAY